MSVVFADLADFTTLSEQLDAEDVAQIQDEYFALAAEAVATHGGQVEKYIGDAVMATFGAGHADDSDPVRAVRAGLAIAGRTAELADGLGLPPGTVRVRVGVNTGEVVVTRRGQESRVTGDTVNTAARLQAEAPPGQVLLGPETAFGVAHAFLLEEHGQLALKGKARPVTAWRVVQERPEIRRGLSMHGLRAPLLGREEESAALDALLDGAAAAARALLVVAPPGAGKSRLVEDFCDRARAAGHVSRVVRLGEEPDRGYACVARLLSAAGRGAWADGDVPSGVVDALVRRGYDRAHAGVLAGHVAALLSGRPLTGEPVDLYAAWTAVLDAGEGPTPIWVIEDLHLAGPDLLAFVAFAVQQPRAEGRLVLLTARPSSGLPTAGELPGVGVLHLEPLTPEATSALVTALVGDRLPARAVEAVVAASGGNPLFTEELLRSWIRAGVLGRDEAGHWILTGGADPSPPSTVQAIYQGQLDALQEGSRAVVERGSIPGVTFPSGALPVLGVQDPDRPLHDLTDVGLLAGPHPSPFGERAYTYRHSLLRDTAYGSLARRERASLHVGFARWLEAGGAGPEVVGTHLATAVDLLPSTVSGPDDGTSAAALAEEAARCLERAAGSHLLASPQRAAVLLRRAMDLPGGTGADRLRRRLALGEAERRSGRLPEAMEAFAAAADLARAREDADAVVSAALGYESALFASRLPRERWGARGVELLRAADAALPPEDRARRSRVLAALGQALVYGGDLAGGAEVGEDAVRLAEEADDPGAAAAALLARRAARPGPEELAGRLADAPRITRAAAATGDLELQLEAARLHLVDVLKAEDLATAADVQAEAEALVARLGRPLYFWYPPMWRAMLALAAGDLAAAGPLVEEFRAEGRRAHYGDVEKVWLAQRLRLQLDVGDVAPLLEEMRAQAERYPERWTFGLALVLALLGRREEAAAHLVDAVADDYARVPRDLSRAYVLAHLAETAALLGDAEVARCVGRLLLPWAGQAVVLGSGAVYLGSGAHYIGLCLRTDGDVEGAAEMFRVAAAANDRAGARVLAARSRAERATTLRLDRPA